MGHGDAEYNWFAKKTDHGKGKILRTKGAMSGMDQVYACRREAVKTGDLQSRGPNDGERDCRFLPASARWLQSTPVLEAERPGLTHPLLLITLCVHAQPLSHVSATP